MNTLNYKGYTAKIEFDPEDNILFGNIIGIRDTLTEKRQNYKIRLWLCLRGKLPGVIKLLSPWLKIESKYF
ncbi:MAG: hypothetical protein QM487_08450, partial [Candidatus Marithrix sp.]